MRYLFIINSKANTKMLKKLENAIAGLSDEVRSNIDLQYTQYAGHAVDLAVEASEQYGNKVTVVACGGDGTVHEVVNALVYRDTPFMCLPLGTGNDFSKSVLPEYLHANPFDMLQLLGNERVIPIDAVRIDSYDVMGNHLPTWSRYFVNVASVGIDTRVQLRAKNIVAKKDNIFNRKTAFIRAVIRQLGDLTPINLSYNLELAGSEDYEISTNEKTSFITICNGMFYGGGFCPAPLARIDDGAVEICVASAVKFFRAMRLLSLYKTGRHTNCKEVKTFSVTSGVITSDDPSFQLQGNYDGEDFFGHRIRFEVFPEALTLAIMPKNKPLSDNQI